MKQKIEKLLGSSSLWDLEGSIEDAIALFQKVKNKYPNYENIIIKCPFDYDNDVSFKFYGLRDETDKEELARLDEEKKNQNYLLEQRRAMFDKLKKEFEG